MPALRVARLARRPTRVSVHVPTRRRALLELTLRGGGTRSKPDSTLERSRWQLNAALDGLDLAGAARLQARVRAAGRFAFRARQAVRPCQWPSASFGRRGGSRDHRPCFADAEGTLAGEGWRARARRARRRTDGFDVTGGMSELTGGKAYSDPVFLTSAYTGPMLDLPAGSTMRAVATRARVHVPCIGTADSPGSATLDFPAGVAAQPVCASKGRTCNAVPATSSHFLIDTALKDIEGAGIASGGPNAGGVQTRASFTFQDVSSIHRRSDLGRRDSRPAHGLTMRCELRSPHASTTRFSYRTVTWTPRGCGASNRGRRTAVRDDGPPFPPAVTEVLPISMAASR